MLIIDAANRRSLERVLVRDRVADRAERPDRVSDRQREVRPEDARRERDGELEEVAPRAAADDDGAEPHGGGEAQPRRRRRRDQREDGAPLVP